MPRRVQYSKAVADHQRELNAWTKKYLDGVTSLRVDGISGHATNSRIMAVKWYLGYGKRDAGWRSSFVRKLRHTHSPRYSPPWQLAIGAKRRLAQRRRYAQSRRPTSGVTTYNGRPVAAWFVPYLDWARRNGWDGELVSGYRDPAYSEHLCYSMCGAPRCPGRCAGRSSNHSRSTKPYGAIDVSDYYTFGRLMRACPLHPKIYNGLGSKDPVHFSSAGN